MESDDDNQGASRKPRGATAVILPDRPSHQSDLEGPGPRHVTVAERLGLPSLQTPVSLVSLPGDSVTPVPPRDGDRSGRYVLGEELGRGGMGRVVAVRDTDLGRVVAYKTLLDEHAHHGGYITALMFEARISGQLEHPNIVPVHELGTTEEGSVYYTMKLAGKVTLKDVLQKLREDDPKTLETYSLPRQLGLLKGICMAAEYAHDRGVIHRDLKPDNVLIGDYGEVQIMDWGIARVNPKDEGDVPLFAGSEETYGLVVGTPHYMSPEQARGDTDLIGPATDIYAIGIILYQILTRTLPFKATSTREQMEAVIKEDMPPPSARRPDLDIPPELERICLKATAYEPEGRYPSARSLWDDIEAFLEGRKEQERLRELARKQAAVADEAGARYYLLRQEMKQLTAGVRSADLASGYFDPLPQRRAAWEQTLQADYHRLIEARAFAEAVAGYNQALAHQPDHSHAREALSALYRSQAQDAYDRGDDATMVLYSDLERTLNEAHAEQTGYLSVRSYPVGARIRLYEVKGLHNLAPEDARDFGEAPCSRIAVAPGTYLLSAELPGCRENRIPVTVREGQDRHVLITLRPWSADLPLFGHRDDLTTVQEAFESCIKRNKLTGVLLLGEEGSGKEKVLVQFDYYLDALPEAIAFVFARCNPIHRHVPFAATSRILRDRAGIARWDGAEVVREKLLSFVTRTYTRDGQRELTVSERAKIPGDVSLIATLPGLCGGAHEAREPNEAPEAYGLRVFRAIVDLFGKLVQWTPLLLKIRGVDNLDRLTRDLLNFMSREFKNAPVFLLGTAREEGDVMQVHRQIQMRPLSPQSVQQQLSVLLGGTVGEVLRDAIYAKSGGNPLNVATLVRLLKRHDWIVRDRHHWALAENYPEVLSAPETTLTDVLLFGLETVGDDAVRVLEAAAVCGNIFWREELSERLGMDVSPSLALLADAEVIAQLPASQLQGKSEYAFRHGVIKQALYGKMADEARAAHHLKVADWLGTHGGASFEALARQVLHYAAAGREDLAEPVRETIRNETRCWEPASAPDWFAWPDNTEGGILGPSPDTPD